jgi:hypothetical protein
MIRRDYIVRMIEEMGRALAQIRALRQGGKTELARQAVDAECEKLTSLGVKGILFLSDTELLARVTEGQLAQTVHLRTLAVVTLLREAAIIAAAENRHDEAHAINLKALHLLLEVLSHEDPLEFPEFVPKVEELVIALADAPLPLQTQTMLMRHYEGTGQYAKAEDALFSILDAVAPDASLMAFGRDFYTRIRKQSDQSLTLGGLPRPEAQQGLAEFVERTSARS